MKNRVIAIGASYNGIAALSALLAALPAGLPAAILVIQHTSPDGPGLLPHVLGRNSRLLVAHARDQEPIEPGRVYVAPPDLHLLVHPDGRLHLSHGPKENGTRPAIDPTFRSVALACGPAAVGIVLTGYLDDGTTGLMAIKHMGGVSIAQDPGEAAAPSMPRSAIRHSGVDHVATVADMVGLIVDLANDSPGEAGDRSEADLFELENLMAQGPLDGGHWKTFQQLSRDAGVTCPACRSTLREFNHGDLACFRCRAGHGYTVRGLLASHAQARSDLEASLFSVVNEEIALLRRIRASDPPPGETESLSAQESPDELERHAQELSRWIVSFESSHPDG